MGYHNFNESSITLLHTATRGLLMTRLEELEIVTVTTDTLANVHISTNLNVYFNSFMYDLDTWCSLHLWLFFLVSINNTWRWSTDLTETRVYILFFKQICCVLVKPCAFLRQLSDSSSINIGMIPSHIDLLEHNIVDLAAKQTAISKTVINNSLLLASDYNNHFHSLVLCLMGAFWKHQPPNKLSPSENLDEETWYLLVSE